MKSLDNYFKLTEQKTNVKTEVIAGITTFLTMAYIIFVNPSILSEAGMDYGAVFVATCLAAAIGCFVMGLWANYPIAQAPGMGLNAFFTYGVVLGMGYTWEAALGAVFFSGLTFFLLSIFKIREWIINSIPLSLRLGIAAGIGLFLAMIALKNAGIVVANPATFVALGDLSEPAPLYALLGFFVVGMLGYVAWLHARPAADGQQAHPVALATAVVTALLTGGAAVNQTDVQHWTPLMHAASMGHEIEDLLTDESRRRWIEWRARLSDQDDYLLPEESGERIGRFFGKKDRD